MRAAQVEPELDYDYRVEGDYIPEYKDYDQSLDQDDVLQLPGSGTLLERVFEAPQGRLQMFARPTKKKTGGVKRERGPRKGWPSPPKRQWEASGTGEGSSHTGPPIEDLAHPPYWNDDPHARWLGPSNVGYTYIDGHRERVLIDSGARANAITPEYCRQTQVEGQAS